MDLNKIRNSPPQLREKPAIEVPALPPPRDRDPACRVNVLAQSKTDNSEDRKLLKKSDLGMVSSPGGVCRGRHSMGGGLFKSLSDSDREASRFKCYKWGTVLSV
jgi:hypothetical protein